MAATVSSILALDVGSKRIGLALASTVARLPQPLTTLEVDQTVFEAISKIVKAENVTQLVVGLPRGMAGQTTAQTEAVQNFTKQLQAQIDLPIDYQDEALTSQHAEQELAGRKQPYTKADIDALAASLILQDWLSEHNEAAHE